MAETRLTGQQLHELRSVILPALTGVNDLTILVSGGLNLQLAAVAGGANLEEVVFNLLQWLEARGRTQDFLNVLAGERPHLAQSLAPFLSAAPVPVAGPPPPATGGRLHGVYYVAAWSFGAVVLGGVIAWIVFSSVAIEDDVFPLGAFMYCAGISALFWAFMSAMARKDGVRKLWSDEADHATVVLRKAVSNPPFRWVLLTVYKFVVLPAWLSAAYLIVLALLLMLLMWIGPWVCSVLQIRGTGVSMNNSWRVALFAGLSGLVEAGEKTVSLVWRWIANRFQRTGTRQSRPPKV